MGARVIKLGSAYIVLMLLQGPIAAPAKPTKIAQVKAPEVLKIVTPLGQLTCELDREDSQAALQRFVAMVEAKQYESSTFCRMVASFFAQGGCPAEKSVGVSKKVELAPKGPHGKAGVLSLAPDAKGLFGQQFIILERPAPWLDASHVRLGQCGPLKTIKALARVPTLAKARARRPIPITRLQIGREGEGKPVNGLAK